MQPFLVAPELATRVVEADVNGQTCSIEFRQYGYLLAGEELHIEAHRYQGAYYSGCSRLADALIHEGVEDSTAEAMASRIISSRLHIPVPLTLEERQAMIRHAALVVECENLINDEARQQEIRRATAAIRFRVAGCSAWSDADTLARIPGPMIGAIATFMDQEQNAGRPVKDPEEALLEVVATLGKLGQPPGADESPTGQDSPPPTGEPSSGDAETSGPEQPTSSGIDSPLSPLTTSTRQSRKGSAAG